MTGSGTTMFGLLPMIRILSRLEAYEFIDQRTTPGREQEFVQPGVGKRRGFDGSRWDRLVKLLDKIFREMRQSQGVVG